MASDSFTGAAAALATHDANWALGSTAEGENLADLRLDGSGFCIQNNSFGTTTAFYTGTSAALKSEIVVPIGAFATLPSSETVGVFVCGGTGGRGIQAELGSANLTGQVINSINIRSGTNFVSTQTLTPTIDTASVALTMSIRRTSTTNCDLIVNGTTYNINTTGLDITSGSSGIFLSRNSATATTLKIDSWTDGAAGGGTTITPSTGSLSFSGVQAQASQGAMRVPTTGALVLAGIAAAVAQGIVRVPTTGSLSIAGIQAAVAQGIVRVPSTGALTLTGIQPVVSQPGATTITPATGALSFAGQQPSLTLGTPSPLTGSLSLTGQQPIVIQGRVIVPGTGSLSLAGNQPTVSGSGPTNVTITPATGSLSLVGIQPVVSGTLNFTITPATGALAFSGQQPQVQRGFTITPSTGALALTGQAALINGQLSVQPNTGALSLVGYQPIVTITIPSPVITPGTGSLTFNGQQVQLPGRSSHAGMGGTGVVNLAGTIGSDGIGGSGVGS